MADVDGDVDVLSASFNDDKIALYENRSDHCYEMPATKDSNAMSMNITNGGSGDDDLTTDGSITGLGGPGVIAGMFREV